MSLKGSRHDNYEILNLIGYGLSKFDSKFIEAFGFKSKTQFFQFCVENHIGETIGTIKNRQDLFDPFFENGRKGWWQKGDAYVHRKLHIDNLFGTLDSKQFADIIKFYLEENHGVLVLSEGKKSPILKSKFKQLQMTGLEAELFFIGNFDSLAIFNEGILEDARLFGDGYDFQIEVNSAYYLVEVKGIRKSSGSVRITENEYLKAMEYKDNYILSIVCNLDNSPQLILVDDPIKNLKLKKQKINSVQTNYHTDSITWL